MFEAQRWSQVGRHLRFLRDRGSGLYTGEDLRWAATTRWSWSAEPAPAWFAGRSADAAAARQWALTEHRSSKRASWGTFALVASLWTDKKTIRCFRWGAGRSRTLYVLGRTKTCREQGGVADTRVIVRLGRVGRRLGRILVFSQLGYCVPCGSEEPGSNATGGRAVVGGMVPMAGSALAAP